MFVKLFILINGLCCGKQGYSIYTKFFGLALKSHVISDWRQMQGRIYIKHQLTGKSRLISN